MIIDKIHDLVAACNQLFTQLDTLSEDDQIDAINKIRLALHARSPMRHEPIDCVLWVRNAQVDANDYNPNAVAPPELKLLERSITEDGFTQPLVTWEIEATDSAPAAGHDAQSRYEVIDGFHRNLVGKGASSIRDRIKHRLPIVRANGSRTTRENRIASTIRHNRARGSHGIDLMVNIVGELVQAGMSDDWISKHIGMDADELLRLKQVSGLAVLFKNQDFSHAWAVDRKDGGWYV